MNGQIKGFIDLVQCLKDEVKNLFFTKRWFSLLLYIGALVFLLFAPETGFFYSVIKHQIEAFSWFTDQIYSFVFLGLIFICFCGALLLKIVQLAKASSGKVRLFLSVVSIVLAFFIVTASTSQVLHIPSSQNDNISWGEESLFTQRSPESFIYENNKEAVETSRNPFKVAVSLPISRQNGVFHSQEILRGVALAQGQWNQEHEKSKFSILIADDGYQESEQEEPNAVNIAKKFIQEKNLLGIIGHFSSQATQAVASIYKENNLVAISPTSTGERCNEKQQSNCVQLNDYIFRTSLTDEKIANKFLGFLSRREPYSNTIKRIAILNESGDIYSNSYKRVFVDTLKKDKQLQSIEIVNPNLEPDYTECDFLIPDDLDQNQIAARSSACLKEAKTKDVDTLLLVPSTKNNIWVENIIAKNSQDGYKFNLVGSDGMYRENFININGKARSETQGMLIPLSWHRDLEVCESNSQELECKAARYFSPDQMQNAHVNESLRALGINWRTAMGYDAAQSLFHSIDQTNQRRCGFQSRIGQRSNCIKKHLQKTLSESIIPKEATSGEAIAFENGDRKTSKRVVVIKAEHGNFKAIP